MTSLVSEVLQAPLFASTAAVMLSVSCSFCSLSGMSEAMFFLTEHLCWVSSSVTVEDVPVKAFQPQILTKSCKDLKGYWEDNHRHFQYRKSFHFSLGCCCKHSEFIRLL